MPNKFSQEELREGFCRLAGSVRDNNYASTILCLEPGQTFDVYAHLSYNVRASKPKAKIAFFQPNESDYEILLIVLKKNNTIVNFSINADLLKTDFQVDNVMDFILKNNQLQSLAVTGNGPRKNQILLKLFDLLHKHELLSEVGMCDMARVILESKRNSRLSIPAANARFASAMFELMADVAAAGDYYQHHPFKTINFMRVVDDLKAMQSLAHLIHSPNAARFQVQITGYGQGGLSFHFDGIDYAEGKTGCAALELVVDPASKLDHLMFRAFGSTVTPPPITSTMGQTSQKVALASLFSSIPYLHFRKLDCTIDEPSFSILWEPLHPIFEKNSLVLENDNDNDNDNDKQTNELSPDEKVLKVLDKHTSLWDISVFGTDYLTYKKDFKFIGLRNKYIDPAAFSTIEDEDEVALAELWNAKFGSILKLQDDDAVVEDDQQVSLIYYMIKMNPTYFCNFVQV